jgi:ribosome-interacting GTPase 1
MMPTNVTAEYKKAEQAFRQARDPHERLVCLKEMLRTLPKHKGTEHLQADIRSRIKGLSEALEGPKKGANRAGPLYTIRPEGAAQIGLIGPPNAGKSSLHVRLTRSHAEVGPYPYTTKLPLPGMLTFEDVHFQLIDLPPVAATYMEPWMGSALEHADAACLVVDLSDPECLEQVTAVCARLTDKKIILTGHWPGLALPRGSATPLGAGQKDHEVRDDDFSDPFRITCPPCSSPTRAISTPIPMT